MSFSFAFLPTTVQRSWPTFGQRHYQHGLFYADPRPGNLLFRPDGHIAVLDYGCVREFDAATIVSLVDLSRAVRDSDDDGLRATLHRLGAKDPAPGPALEAPRGLLRGFFGPVLAPGRRRLQAGVNMETRSVLRSKRAMLKLRIPGRLLILFRIRFGLYAVLARLGAEVDRQALEMELAASTLPRTAPP